MAETPETPERIRESIKYYYDQIKYWRWAKTCENSGSSESYDAEISMYHRYIAAAEEKLKKLEGEKATELPSESSPTADVGQPSNANANADRAIAALRSAISPQVDATDTDWGPLITRVAVGGVIGLIVGAAIAAALLPSDADASDGKSPNKRMNGSGG